MGIYESYLQDKIFGQKANLILYTVQNKVYKLIFSTIYTIQLCKLFQTEYVSLIMMASPLYKHKCCYMAYVTIEIII